MMMTLRNWINQFRIKTIDLAPLVDKCTSSIFWPSALALVIAVLAASFEKSIISQELLAQGLLKPGYTGVSIRTEHRKMLRTEVKNSQLIRMTQIDPQLFTLMTTEAAIDFPSLRNPNGPMLRRSVPVVLTTDGFFNAAGGKLVRGRVFRPEEVRNASSVAVITSGLAKTLWGSSKDYAETIFIDGRQVTVVGMWEFQPETLEENQALFIPLSTGDLVASMDFSPITRFVIHGDDSAALERLKRVLDQIQLTSIGPIGRPEFRMIAPPATSKNSILWKTKKSPLDFIIPLFCLFILIISAFAWDRTIAQSQDIITWRRWITNDARKVRNQILKTFLLLYYLWLCVALLVCAITILITNQILHLDLLFSISLDFSIIIITLLIPGLIAWITDIRVKRNVRLGRWI
ncbi:MAG: ABC transporter permease [Bdellovibrionales bacterium]|nr:ABC transporter permease [Bdellovibrionales bacterium]